VTPASTKKPATDKSVAGFLSPCYFLTGAIPCTSQLGKSHAQHLFHRPDDASSSAILGNISA